MSDGKIKYPETMRKTRLYAMEALAKYCRGKISPTDVDAMFCVHCKHRGGRHLFVEYKTEGVPMEDAQRWTMESLIEIGQGRIWCVLAEHPDLAEWEVVEPIADVQRFKLFGWVDGSVLYGPWVHEAPKFGSAGERLGKLHRKFLGNLFYGEEFLVPYLRRCGTP